MKKIANPIYDIVFKYLMEDERIARTILSALLRVEVVKVEMRHHEYSDDSRDTLSVYRIDFGATIRNNDGQERLILIELQKTWLETETLRFRQYLSVQYSNPKNIDTMGNALPMVAIYLLGHKVGDVEEPVLYVSHRSYDSEGNIVTKGLPNPFIDSLTHDSIIVQIPRLRGLLKRSASSRQPSKKRLDMVLSIFDQTQRDEDDSRLLSIDDQAYGDDADMEHIIHRLTMAAADADMRHRMNVEDEYFSAIEKRDTVILMRDHKIAEQKAQISEQKSQISEQQSQINEQQSQISEQQNMLRLTVKMLVDSGKSLEEIATSVGKDLATVRLLAK